MATVIEQAIVRISPSFKGFKDDLITGINEATAGVHGTVDVKLNVDSRHLHSSIETALAGMPKTKSTVKVAAEFDKKTLKDSFNAALNSATSDLASKVAAGQVRVGVNRTFLKADLEAAARAAVTSVGNILNNGPSGGLKVHVDPVLDTKKLDAELLKLSQKTVTIKVRYDTSGSPSLPGSGSLRLPAGGGGGPRPPSVPGTGGAGGAGGAPRRQTLGSSTSQSATPLAEFINALPGVGGFGPNAARVVLQGIAAATPAIVASLQAAVALGLGAGAIAGGIAIAAQVDRVRNIAGLVGGSIKGTLVAAAKPFTDALLNVMPRLAADFQTLGPQLSGIFAAFAPSLQRLESGLTEGLRNALNPQAAQNAAQFVDALADKMPQIGAAIGQFLVDVTDPRSVAFFKGLIDVVDSLIAGIGKLVNFLGRVNQALSDSGAYAALNQAAKTLLGTVGAVANAFGPGLTAGIAAVGAAFLLLRSRATTAGTATAAAWSEARIAFQLYASSVAAGGGVIGSIGPTVAATRAAGGAPGLARAGGAALGGGLALGGVIGGTALAANGQPEAGGALTGAGLGAMVGMMLPGGPFTALAGAGLGAIFGGLAASTAKQQQATESLTQAFQVLGGQVKASGGQVTPQAIAAAAVNHPQFADVVRHPGKYGVDITKLGTALASQDPAEIQKQINAAEQKRKDENKNHPQHGPQGAKYNAVGDADRKAFIDTLKQALAQAQITGPPIIGPTTPPWTGTVYEKFQQRMTGTTPPGVANNFTTGDHLNIAAEVQTINQAAAAYKNYNLAVRAVGDAQYQQAQTAQQTAQANEAACHAVEQAEHGLAQAHFATEMAQRSLNEARKQAIQNLTELKRQTRDLGDNEESLKIRVIEADLAEQQTRGIDPMSLVRRKVILEQHSAHNAYTDFQEDRPVLLDKYNTAVQRGVEGDTGVMQAKNALSESQYNEAEQVRNVKIAHDNLNNTLEASRRANDLACRAVKDAKEALGEQAAQLYQTAAALGLSVDEVKQLYEHNLKINRKFECLITDNGSAKATMGEVANLYEGLVDLAKAFGIDLPGWMETASALPPQPTTTSGNQGWKSNPLTKASGGVVDGWSPHDRADNIQALLTADEYVVNAKSSRKHRGLLHAINADRHYADGGLVLPMDSMVKGWQAPARANLDELNKLAGLSGDSGTNGNVASVQSWLRSGVDPLPYVWGRVGPSAFDCSGLVGEVWARLTGHPSNTRYFVTGNERQFLTSHGFRDGTGTFTVGFSGEHTMGNIGGLSFEAANARSGIHVGSGTSDVTKFPNVMYLPQFGDQFVGSGGQPPDASAVHIGGIWGQIMRKILTDAKTAALGGGGDSGKADAADANVARIAYNTAKAMGADPKSLLALFEAGIVESGMQNVDHGPDGSLGFLQQRASWGSAASRQNVADSTRRFLNKAMRLSGSAATAGSLAQDVQVSAYPDKYDRNRNAAIALLSRFDKNLQFGGFDNGGWLRDVGVNTSGTPEAVLTNEQSRAYVRHAESLSGSGGEVRLDEWTISRLAQAMSTRPIPVNVDGRHVADAVVPHLERRIRR